MTTASVSNLKLSSNDITSFCKLKFMKTMNGMIKRPCLDTFWAYSGYKLLEQSKQFFALGLQLLLQIFLEYFQRDTVLKQFP